MYDPFTPYREKSPTRRRARMHPVLRGWHEEYERRCAQTSPNAVAVAFAFLVSALQGLGAAALVWWLVRVLRGGG